MTIAQTKAVRKKTRNDPRYKPKRGNRTGTSAQDRRNRKMLAAGKGIGISTK